MASTDDGALVFVVVASGEGGEVSTLRGAAPEV